MTTKTSVVVMGIIMLLGGAGAAWYFAMEKWSAPYQETNASWRIQGVCTDAQNGIPIKGAQITASFREPIAFEHHWTSPPPLKTINVVTETDDDGRFEVTGEGGSAYIKAQAEGFLDPEPGENWSYSARNKINRVDTNITLGLNPISKQSNEGKSSKQ